MTRAPALVVLVAMLTVASAALAGTKISSQVYVSSTKASGALGTARKSPDSLQYIGCNVVASQGGSGTTVAATCYARDAAGNTASCSTSDPTLVQVALSLNGDDFFEFHYESNILGSFCTSMNVGKYSTYEPK